MMLCNGTFDSPSYLGEGDDDHTTRYRDLEAFLGHASNVSYVEWYYTGMHTMVILSRKCTP